MTRRAPEGDAAPGQTGTAPRVLGVAPLTAGTLVSGIAGFLVIALGTRAVGETLFAPVSVLWSFWALSAAAVSFPLQHWVIRSASTAGEAPVWHALRRVAVTVGGASVVLGITTAMLGERLYTTSPGAFAIMTALLPVGSALVGVHRGFLAHRERFTAVAVTLAGENIIRVAITLVVLVVGSPSPASAAALGWGIIAGFGIVLLVGPPGPRWDHQAEGRTTPPSLRLLGGFAGANVSAQAVLSSAPVLLSMMRAPEATVTQVFVVLALVRVPYTALVGASAGISGPLARMVDSGRGGQLRRTQLRGAALTVLLAVLAAMLAPRILPPVADLLFATSITISAASQSMLAAGGVLSLSSLLAMLVLLANQRPARLLNAWGTGLLAAAIVLLAPGHPVTLVSTAFLVAMGTSVMVMVWRDPAA